MGQTARRARADRRVRKHLIAPAPAALSREGAPPTRASVRILVLSGMTLASLAFWSLLGTAFLTSMHRHHEVRPASLHGVGQRAVN